MSDLNKIELSRYTIEHLLSMVFDDEWTMSSGEDIFGKERLFILVGWPNIERKYYKRFNRLIKAYKEDKELEELDA